MYDYRRIRLVNAVFIINYMVGTKETFLGIWSRASQH